MRKTENDMAGETDKLLDSNYDGIQEYDNDLPLWWVALFFFTIFWGMGYIVYYRFGPGLSTTAALEEEMAAAQAAQQTQLASNAPAEVTDDQLLALTKDAAVIAQGQGVFASKCLACHGPQGQGLVGPNLTDDYWIHGAKLTDNLRTVREGVLDKGMLAWKGLLSPDEIKAVVAYAYTLRGTNPPNPKAPQGEPAATTGAAS